METVDDLLIYLNEKEKMQGRDAVAKNPIIETLLNMKEPIIIYGAGAVGHVIYNILVKNDIRPQYFCSGIKSGYKDLQAGIDVIDKGELVKYNKGIVILSIGDTASRDDKKQIRRDIMAMGYKENQIVDHNILEEKVSPSFLLKHMYKISEVYDLLADEESKRVYIEKLKYMIEYKAVNFECFHVMYADTDIIKFESNEVIIDAGAYNGDSALLFRSKAGATADIYAFEPDFANYNDLKSRVCTDSKIYPEMLGLWNRKDFLLFSDDHNGSSHIDNGGGFKVQVIDLDSYCSEKGIIPSYIKMDIEGAEMEAIQGAGNTIRRNKPKLAICLYHKPVDIIEIPLLIHKINPQYKIYIRHYSNCQTDTLLYAV